MFLVFALCGMYDLLRMGLFLCVQSLQFDSDGEQQSSEDAGESTCCDSCDDCLCQSLDLLMS